jgi:hypothetical protein
LPQSSRQFKMKIADFLKADTLRTDLFLRDL